MKRRKGRNSITTEIEVAVEEITIITVIEEVITEDRETEKGS